MKILVTGAKGQLGKKIIEILGSKYELILTDSDTMDITSKSEVQKVIKKENPNYIIHCAAYTKVDAAEDNVELCRKINTLGTRNVAQVATENNSTLIYISTDFVFDGQKNAPYTEEDLAKPLSIYGLTKFEGEENVREICQKYYILRISWLFGELPEGHPGSNFVETMLRLAAGRELLTIVNDQVGSPTYTGDLVVTMSKIIETNPEFGTYHFSGDGSCSWYDFAKEIFAQTKTKIELKPIMSNEFPQKAKRPKYSYLDKSKIEHALDIKVRSWKKMLGEYLGKRK